MQKMKPLLSRALVAFLFALGLTLPVLGALDLMAHAFPCAALLLGLCAILAAASLHRRVKLVLGIAALAGIGLYLSVLGGWQSLREILLGVVLQFSGIQGALPLVAAPCALLIAAVFGIVCWALTSPSAGFYPPLAVLLLVMMILWLTSRTALLLYTLPALVAMVVLYVQSGHAHVPLGRILPMAVLAVALSFLLTPSGGVSVPTLEKFASDIRQRVYDYFFFTEPRDVFSLSTEGYYPQGITQLGGTAEPTDHPVMQVQTPKRVLLRGAIMNEYTGRIWRNTTGGRRYLYISPRWSSLRNQLFDTGLPQGEALSNASLLEEQTITIRLLSENASNLFLPQRVRSLNVKGDLVPYFNNASEVFATRDLEAGDTYTVTAPLLMAGDAGLGTIINACASTTDDNYAAVLETYLQLPDHLQQPLYDLAERITQEAETPYEKAFALQNYLSRNFRYTLEVAPQDSTIDFVTNFLLNTKEGYCTYFASAMTVLCRMVGLPARYVEGYQAIPDENGIAYVTGLQAHAWTEVYFAGFGWLTFDATPVQSGNGNSQNRSQDDGSGDAPTPTPTLDPSASSANQEDEPTPTPPLGENVPTPTPTPTPNPTPQAQPTPETNKDTHPNSQEPSEPPHQAGVWLLLLALVLAAAAGLRIYWTQPAQLLKKAKDPTGSFMVWVQAVFDLLRLRKLPMAASESPIAYGKRLDALRTLPLELTPLCEALSLVCYGKIVPEPEEIDMAAKAYGALFAALPWWQKVQLILQRAFWPLKKRDFTHR